MVPGGRRREGTLGGGRLVHQITRLMAIRGKGMSNAHQEGPVTEHSRHQASLAQLIAMLPQVTPGKARTGSRQGVHDGREAEA